MPSLRGFFYGRVAQSYIQQQSGYLANIVRAGVRAFENQSSFLGIKRAWVQLLPCPTPSFFLKNYNRTWKRRRIFAAAKL